MEKRAWWWNKQVTKDISEKRRLWKLWKARDLDAKNAYIPTTQCTTCLLHSQDKCKKKKNLPVLKTIKKITFGSQKMRRKN